MDVQTKCTISIDHLIARIDWHEAPTVEDLVSAVQSILGSPEYHSGLCLLIVDHGTNFDLDESKAQELIRQQGPQLKHFKCCAISSAKDRHRGIARKVASHVFHDGTLLGSFNDEVAAGVWLLSMADS